MVSPGAGAGSLASIGAGAGGWASALTCMRSRYTGDTREIQGRCRESPDLHALQRLVPGRRLHVLRRRHRARRAAPARRLPWLPLPARWYSQRNCLGRGCLGTSRCLGASRGLQALVGVGLRSAAAPMGYERLRPRRPRGRGGRRRDLARGGIMGGMLLPAVAAVAVGGEVAAWLGFGLGLGLGLG